MIYKRYLLLFFTLVLISCNRTKEKKVSAPLTSHTYHSNSQLIEVEELISISKNQNIKIIDFRKEEKYLESHIPNALNIWRSDIEGKAYPYKGMVANKSTIEKLLQNLGIHENDIIIIYDDRGLCDAARLWWVLKTYNFKTIKLLNGGWQAWKETGGQMSINIPVVIPSNIKLIESKEKEMYVGRSDVLELLNTTNDAALLDTRTIEEYSGLRMKEGAKRSGRIPQSKHIDWMNAIDEKNMQKFKSQKALESIYTPLLTSKDQAIIAYCHTGVRSAHTTFVLTELLGYTNVKNYDGSWSEWSYYENLPIEKDSVTRVLN